MKRFLFLILLIPLLISAGFLWETAAAQDFSNPEIASLEVQLLPEYDCPGMLVIWRVTLSAETALPREVMFKIPAKAESLSITLSNQTENHIPLEGDAITSGGWQNIRFIAPASEIRIEYHDTNLIKQDDRREYHFEWQSAYPVSSLSVILHPPYGADELKTDPVLPASTNGEGNPSRYTGEFSDLAAGETFSLHLSYARDTTSLSYPALDVAPAMPIDESTAGRSASPLSVILWLLMVALAVLISAGLYYWWSRANILEKREQAYDGVGIINPDKRVVFCHECGMRSRAGDSYCRNCGTPLHPTNQKNHHPHASRS